MKLLTAKEATEAAGLTNSNSIRAAIKRGRLRAAKFGRDWMIEEGELKRWLKEERHITPKQLEGETT